MTLIFVDIVDSTRLAQSLDPERAREVLGKFFDAASDELVGLRGRPEKFVGDAVMAVFGLPHVHEDDALRAVRAGLAIRARTVRLGQSLGLPEPLLVRIGIESGEAAVGHGPSGQLLVTGPVVNAAARLQSSAHAGEVLAGKTTRALTADKVSFGRQRRVKAKGFDEALEAFPVESLTPRSARRTIPFVGRAGELAILGQSLGLAGSSGRPVLVTVVGEPGIGKSRLVDELAAGVSAAVPILRGSPRSDTDTATFSPAAAIIADLAGLNGDEAPPQVLVKLRTLVDQCCGHEQADRVVQRLALLFGVADRPEQTDFVHEVQAGFIAVIDGLARDHPVLLLFDDVHELKPPMQDLVERLAVPGQGRPRRALVLAVARGELLEQRPGWGSGSTNAVLMRLNPLSPDDAV
ncbi:MAG TPA: AAA family ATPase, partial [Candidatus Udaeobacter sp.]|nr:AAA family ATPase [Candidatus Udaeobacter sp.]